MVYTSRKTFLILNNQYTQLISMQASECVLISVNSLKRCPGVDLQPVRDLGSVVGVCWHQHWLITLWRTGLVSDWWRQGRRLVIAGNTEGQGIWKMYKTHQVQRKAHAQVQKIYSRKNLNVFFRLKTILCKIRDSLDIRT